MPTHKRPEDDTFNMFNRMMGVVSNKAPKIEQAHDTLQIAQNIEQSKGWHAACKYLSRVVYVGFTTGLWPWVVKANKDSPDGGNDVQIDGLSEWAAACKMLSDTVKFTSMPAEIIAWRPAKDGKGSDVNMGVFAILKERGVIYA